MKKFTKIRQEIKRLSDQQRVLKSQRKPSSANHNATAQIKVLDNKYELRHLFQAYAILKGIERPEVTKKEIYETKVNDLVDKYREVE